jgi:hypothetical protein
MFNDKLLKEKALELAKVANVVNLKQVVVILRNINIAIRLCSLKYMARQTIKRKDDYICRSEHDW